MISTAAGFVVVLTFAVGIAHVDEKPLPCEDWKCVQNVLDEAHTSPYLQRIRVYSKPDYVGGWLTIDDKSIFPPMLDEWLN